MCKVLRVLTNLSVLFSCIYMFIKGVGITCKHMFKNADSCEKYTPLILKKELLRILTGSQLNAEQAPPPGHVALPTVQGTVQGHCLHHYLNNFMWVGKSPC